MCGTTLADRMKIFVAGIVLTLNLLRLGFASGQDLSPREIYEQASPAVVMVMGHPDGTGEKGSGGTGSIIRSDGYVLTNAHVVIDERTGRPFPRLSVFLKPPRVTGNSQSDLSRMIRAKIVGYSQQLDLALLKLDSVSGPLPTVGLDDSTGTRIGDRVAAIGHPEQGGLWTLTTGVISAEVDNFNGVQGKNVFQTETGLNRGNSGGPLLDTSGRMIGVNTAIARVASDGLPITSISFSLKSNVAAQWLREQGIGGRSDVGVVAPPTQTQAVSEMLSPSLPPPAKPVQPSSAETPTKPTKPDLKQAKPDQARPDPARPYNLDKLVSERARAEAELTDMINEMRGRMKER
ncbi:MAG: trypsin-like peptidase domain-containing protein [Nitrospira sp.]|nr:trypsin-like peptidase domain-containing protein [Nitrospira sp.]